MLVTVVAMEQFGLFFSNLLTQHVVERELWTGSQETWVLLYLYSFLKKLCDSGHIVTPFSKHGSLICKMKASTRGDDVK